MTDAWFIYLKKLDDVITWDGAFHSRKDDEVYIREQEEDVLSEVQKCLLGVPDEN